MPSLNFESWKAAKVESGESHQTIRRERKRPIVYGDTLYLFTGQRTKKCRRLGQAICRDAESIRIETFGVIVSGRLLSADETLALALADGFTSLGPFYAFFSKKYGLPFQGVLIKW